MRLAWFSPLPPMASGIADYSFELLPWIAAGAEVDVYCPGPGGLRRLRVPPGVRLVSPNGFARRVDRYDAVVHHLGNNPHHRFVYEAAMEHPGIAVFHDFVMHHLMAYLYVESFRDRARYEALLADEYGDTGRRLSDLRFHGVASEFEKFVFPLNRHIAERAGAIVVHSKDARERMREIVPDTPVRVIPHHAGSPPSALDGVTRAAARARLGLPPDAFLVGHFGFITRPKQPAAVLGGFARLAARRADAQLVMIGADTTGGGLGRQIARLALTERVRLAGFVGLEAFYLYLRAVDAVINLRYPSAGESSGTFCRALAEGRPAVVNNLGSFAEIPDDAALKVEVDGDQAAEVGAHLIRLAEDPAFRTRIEAGARRYATTVLDQRRCAELYLDFAREVAGSAQGASHSAVASRP